MSLIKHSTKRGDTIVEVTLAFAIFSLAAIATIAMMNMGLSASERSLELVTARNELNAQAEALRFIHSSYISELTLPECDKLTPEQIANGEKCQQYRRIWQDITNNAIRSADMTIEYPLASCDSVYDNSLLAANNAFVINTREIMSSEQGQNTVSYGHSDAILWASKNNNIFQAAPLNARIVYSASTGANGDSGQGDSTDQISSISLNKYLRVAKVEGIWIIPVSGPANRNSKPQYYDFYIETCWYGSGNNSPTSLDSIVRLYNPEGA